VQQVTHNIGVAAQLNAAQLALLWGRAAEEVVSSLLSLRTIGYEVRSHHANPQIKPGD